MKQLTPEEIKEIKQRAYQWGVWSERMALWLLRFKGYKILEQRYRNPHGEVDIVARKRGIIVFVEVKARKTLDDAAYAVQPRQKIRITKAASAYMGQHPEYQKMNIRFDAVLCVPWKMPEHLQDAWRPY